MRTIPSITASIPIRKRGFLALQTQIPAAHNRLAHVVEAMDHMPVVVLVEARCVLFRWRKGGRETRGCEGGVCLDDGEEAVELVGY